MSESSLSCVKVTKLFARNKHNFWNYCNSLRKFIPWLQRIKLWTNFSDEILGIPTITLSHLQLLKLQIMHMCTYTVNIWLLCCSSIHFNAKLNYWNYFAYCLCETAVIRQKLVETSGDIQLLRFTKWPNFAPVSFFPLIWL